MMKRLSRLILVIAPVIILGGESVIFSPALGAGQLALPSGDLIAPVVTHESISESLAAGSSYEFKVRVTDNVGVKSVVLFYRTSGSENYKRVAMHRSAQMENLYTYLLSADAITAPGLEYYIQAEDLAGNTLLQGQSFSPMTAKVMPGTGLVPSTVASGTDTTTEMTDMPAPVLEPDLARKSSLLKNKWLWIGAGVVVGGAGLVYALGSGSDPDPDTSSVTITATVP